MLLTLGGKQGTASIASMGEGIDATNINLPVCQDQLIVKLAELGKPIIGVHVDGRPVSSDAADTHLAALLEVWSGTEIIQVYISDKFASVSRPVQELAGFRGAYLEPGQTAQVEFHLDVTQLAFLDADMRWLVDAGEVDIIVGASSNDLRLTESVSIVSGAVIDGRTRGFYVW